jgi:hypothetical protein
MITSSLERQDNKALLYMTILNIIITPTFLLLSSLTGSAILSNSYSGYNNIEAMIMAVIGSPFILVINAIDHCLETEKKSPSSVILGLSATSVISSLIGYAIYNEFNETEMTVGKTAAASAVGSAVIGLPFVCLAACGAIAYLEMKNESDRNENMQRQLDGINSLRNTLNNIIESRDINRDEESNIEFVNISSGDSQKIKSIANIA